MDALQSPGRQVGRYRIVTSLGEGGMGEVYDAIDPSLGRHVALKILKGDAVADPQRLGRFIQEARAASALNHPHLISIYEIGEDAGTHFIAMERVDGSTLRDLAGHERLPLTRSLDLMAQISEAVAAAHDAGIIHRDLKPENVMVSRSGYVKVLDFGLAKLQPVDAVPVEVSESTLVMPTESGVVLGTVGYMSPEQAQGRPADARSDTFALGCILYELISGTRPFYGTSAVDTLHRIIHEEPRPLSDAAPSTPPEVQRIVRKAMAKDPAERYQSARDMTIGIRHALRETGAPPRRRGAWVLAALAAVAIVLAIGVPLARRDQRAAAPALHTETVTDTGDVIHASISPDGKYMAYVRYDERGQALWVRELASGQDLVLVPGAGAGATLWGATFNRDSNAVFFVRKTAEHPEGSLYRISVLGGRAEHLLDGIDSPVSFSPDGSSMTWVRSDVPNRGESALMVGASDGGGVQTIATRRPPELFSPLWFTRPSWSPDGKWIAVSVLRQGPTPRSKILGVDPKTREVIVIADPGWQGSEAVEWLPDGKGLLTVAGSTPFSGSWSHPVWYVPFRGGPPRAVTRDVAWYRTPSVTADGRKMLCIAVLPPILELWKSGAGGADQQPQKVVAGEPLGFDGIGFLPDGSIASASGGVISVITTADDGTSHAVPAVKDRFQNRQPVGVPGGIVYQSLTPNGPEICRTSLKGEGRTVLAAGTLLAVTRDGAHLVYRREGTVWNRDLRNGREKPLLAAGAGVRDADIREATWSPENDRIAISYGNDPQAQIGVVSSATGRLLSTIPANPWTQNGYVSARWTPDGSALLVHDWSNIWRLPLRGEPQKVTNFYGQIAVYFDLSFDGKEIAMMRSQWHRDAVIMTGFE